MGASMRRLVRFLIGLAVGLGLLAWLAAVVVQRTTREWVRRDLVLRARLALHGTRQALVPLLRAGRAAELRLLLAEIAHDERILATAACSPQGVVLASTPDFPFELPLGEITRQMRPTAAAPAQEWREWSSEMALPTGPIHVSALPVIEQELATGFVVLVHDLSYAERREDTAMRFLLIAFGVLVTAAAVVTVVTARLTWRGWRSELRRLLSGQAPPPEFQPILRDVRDLVDRLVGEIDSEHATGAWNAGRLKDTLGRHLHGERIVIVANREPYIHDRAPDGTVRVLHPASGLVTALEPVMRACSGVWVAHGSGTADRDLVDDQDRVRVPPGEESYRIRRVWLSPAEEQGYYYGFANEGLWPLCHIAHTRPTFRGEDWDYYQEVNRRFAAAVGEEVEGDDPIVMVQDYHFALAPRILRERMARATVLMFWHIPWPNAERLGICPWRDQLLRGMLGASILGFHTQQHCNNFLDSVDRFLEARIDREQNAVIHHGRRTLVRPYPISLEWPSHWLSTAPDVATCRTRVRQDLGLAADVRIGVGVDRLDYTKGIEERLLAVERALERYPALRGRFAFVQLAAPSRTAIERYRQLDASVTALAERINARFASDGYQPIHLLRSHHEPPDVFRFYRAADLCYVSSLHDGMNLVAKEFVAARDDALGVLVLSQFTGAARELTEALIVNPYDLDQASAALATALHMAPEEQRDRMVAMRAWLAEFNVYRWAGRMLTDAAQLRRRERLAGRLAEPDVAALRGLPLRA